MSPAAEAARDTVAVIVGVVTFFTLSALYPAVVLGAIFVLALILGIYLMYTSFYEDAKKRAAVKAVWARKEKEMLERDARLQAEIEKTKLSADELRKRIDDAEANGAK